MSTHAFRRRGSALLALIGLASSTAVTAALVTAGPAHANTAGNGLVINEVYGAGGNAGAALANDFIELANPTSAAIDVSTWSVQYASSAGSSWQVTNLTGSVPANSYYLVQEASGGSNGTAIPKADVTGTINLSGTTGKVALLSNQTALTVSNPVGASGVVDFVGFGTANAFEGSVAPAPSSTTSIARTNLKDTDQNGTDFSAGTPTPQNSSTSTGGGGGGTSSPLAATAPGDQTLTVGQSYSKQLAATGGTSPYSWTVQSGSLPDGVTLSTGGLLSGTPMTAATTSATIRVTDSANPAATNEITVKFTVNPAAPSSLTIAQIQGDNTDTSPYAGQTVTTTGVVTASYPTGGLAGFDIQTPGTPNTPNASDGLFVYAGSALTASQYPAVGDAVSVTGPISEYKPTSASLAATLTELTVSGASSVTDTGASSTAVVPLTSVPGTVCDEGSCATTADVNAARELHESELIKPTGNYTVTDPYDGSPSPSSSSQNFAEIGLAAERTSPLVIPTEDYDAQTQTAQIAARTQYNSDHEINIDDGSSTNYSTATGSPLPWFTPTHDVRVGAAVTFVKPFVLSYGNDEWRLEPPAQVTDDGEGVVHVVQTRDVYKNGPANVGGDLRLATFNVLNYFPTTGDAYVAADSANKCTFYYDRNGNSSPANEVTTNSCGNPSTSSGNGPRGAANDANFKRQQAKIVAAINTSGADIVSLEEIENSVKFGKDRDSGVSTLVDALNAATGSTTWAFAPSPSAANLPTTDQQDVIRTAFIYKPATTELVGGSEVLTTESSDTAPTGAFSNAREPLAQAFKKKGAPDSAAFGVVVNHFKSKGSGTDDKTGQGNANPDRVAQAKALLTFAGKFQADRGNLAKMFLVGDFNAYSSEDPVQEITAGGYSLVNDNTAPIDSTYNFGGQNGSLDHVFANAAALPTVTGADVWAINAYESVYYEYSRFNYNVTQLYDTTPFRASDHNPEVVGINSTVSKAATTTSGTAATITYGNAGTLNVSVTAPGGGTPTGTVTVSEGSTSLGTVTLANGAGTLTLPAKSLAVGDHTLTLAYSGDANFAASQGSAVVKVRSGVTVKGASTPDPIVYDAGGKLTVTVADAATPPAGTPSGTVKVTEGSKDYGTLTLSGGTASLDLPAKSLSVGNHTFTLAYSGDGTYAATTGTATVTVSPGTVTLNLLNFNDFHGRIDAGITAQWATTIEQLRAAGGADNTLLLSAGDSIGASLFPSASQKDNPTLDVLNALGVNASSVGNHEFDQGFGDLTGHVANRSNFKYLGANVYFKGTTTPALPEYQVFKVQGVRVGVIGAVTQETPSLVSPTGVSNLDFGDPVDAVNRVAGQLTDGDDKNGEADVVLAEYHEGAPAGDVEKATLASNQTNSAVFNKIVTQTSPKVNAIFTGHTHKLYAYSAPVPGSTSATRPVTQAGSYGDYVTQVSLTYDGSTHQVTAHTERNVPKASSIDTTYPRVAAVKQITDKALADAAKLGNQPVGTITADITTAFTGGTVANGVYTAPTANRDDRGSESTLGDLIGQVLKDGVTQAGTGTPDLGITNPGGLRAELYFKGDTSTNPQNTDGVVTYAEANSVLPFNNNVSLVKLTGASVKQILEQQYQTNADGTVPSRSYLQLGLSGNVRVTTDPTKPAGSRITSVYIDDKPLDPAKTYTVATNSFLAAGGDNFRAFTQGTSTDTGQIDADLLRTYLANHPGISPDFARQQVTESGLPASLTPGTPASFTLSKLDLTSQGSPANSSVVATIGSTQIGSWTVTNGTANINVTVPSDTTGSGYVVFTAKPSGTVITVPYTGTGGGTGGGGTGGGGTGGGGGGGGGTTTTATTTTLTTSGVTYGAAGSVHVVVAPASGTAAPSGTVTVSEGSTSLGTITLANGAGDLALPARSLEVGSHTLTAAYAGSATFAASSGNAVLTVSKATPTVTAAASPDSVAPGGTTSVAVTVAATGFTPTGTVSVRNAAGTVLGTGTLNGGSASITVGPFTTTGRQELTVAYGGDAHANAASTTTMVAVGKLDTTTTAQVRPDTVAPGDSALVTVAVQNADGSTSSVPTGDVTVQRDGAVVGRGSLVDGQVVIETGDFTDTGRFPLTVVYAGDDAHTGSATSVVVKVRKIDPKVKITAPDKALAGDDVDIRIDVSDPDDRKTDVDGKVEVSYRGGKTQTVKLRNGSARVTLTDLPTGKVKVHADYQGNDRYADASDTATITVKRDKRGRRH